MRYTVVNKLFDKIIYKLFEERLLKRYFYVVIANLVGAIGYNLLLYPTKIVAGGSGGLSILVQSTFGIEPSIFILVFSTTVLVLSVAMIGFEKSSGAIVSTFLYPLFIDLTSGLSSIISIQGSDLILISLFAGIISGWTSGIAYKVGFSGSGTSLISKILYEKFNISISKTNFIVNMIIVVGGGVYYGIENIMYAAIVLYASSVVIDRVLLGISEKKMFYIITSKDAKVKEFLVNEIGHSVTEFDVIGGYNSKADQVIMTVIPTKEYFKVTEGIKQIDKNAFFVVTDSYETANGS